jgi:hypothetical protein
MAPFGTRVLIGVVVIGLAACGGGGDDAAQSCASFQLGVTDAYNAYSGVKAQVMATVSTVPIEPSDAVRAQVAADLSNASLAAEQAATEIRVLGTPGPELAEAVDLTLSSLQAEAEAFSLWSGDQASQDFSAEVMDRVQALLSEANSSYDRALGLWEAQPCSGSSG